MDEPVTHWSDPVWLAAASTWAREAVAGLGLAVEGDIEQVHRVAWSTVLRVPTGQGPFWLKAQIPVLAHEAGVVRALHRLRPDLIAAVVADDPERGWMLLADAGARLRERLAGDRQHAPWLQILPLYAGLQRDSAAIQADLVAAGAPDRRGVAFGACLEQLLADRAALQPHHDEALSQAELDRLPALGERVDEAGAALAALGVPEAVQHDDFHDGQVFVRDGGYAFADWSDACVSHPFLTLIVTLRVLALRLGVEDGSARLAPFRDAYLEAFTDLAPRRELHAALPAVELLGRVNRALTWHRIVGGLPRAARAAEADAVPAWLRYALELV